MYSSTYLTSNSFYIGYVKVYGIIQINNVMSWTMKRLDWRQKYVIWRRSQVTGWGTG